MAPRAQVVSAAGATRPPSSRFRRQFSRVNVGELRSLEQSRLLEIYHEDIERLRRRIAEQSPKGASEGKGGATTAKEKMVVSVLLYAKKVAAQYAGGELSFPDLVQEASIGVLKALERYDPSKGSFVTYADWWIRQSILLAFKEVGTTVRRTKNDNGARIFSFQNHFMHTFGRAPFTHEIAEALGITERSVVFLMERNHYSEDYSLDAPKGGNGDDEPRTLGERLTNFSEFSPETRVTAEYEFRAAKTEIRRVFAGKAWHNLSPRDKQIILLRYGLDGSGESFTNKKISEEVDLSIEGVRQVVAVFWKRVRRVPGSTAKEREIWFRGELERIAEISEYLEILPEKPQAQ